jgi:hypothetical protein
MKWLRIHIAIIVLILIAYAYVDLKRPPIINWDPTFSRYDRIPFGTYVLYDQLEHLFDTAPTPHKGTIYDHLNNRQDSGELYMIIAGAVNTSKADEQELLRHVAIGNTVFIAANELSRSLQDSLGCRITSFDLGSLSGDSVSLSLVNPAFGKHAGYRMMRNTVNGHFEEFDTVRSVIAGMNSGGKVNFIRMDIGKGRLFLHTAPLAFSNFFILKEDNHQYVSHAMSLLPKRPTAMFWDDYYSIGRGGPTTPLRVILTRPSLRAAYFTALGAIMLFMLFHSKRRQRVIPVIPQTRNTTMDFLDTVSQLYLSRRDHRDIALKQAGFFLDHVRSRYGIATGMLDDDFVRRLSQRSGVTEDRTRELVDMIEDIRSATTVVEPELMRFSRSIDEFHKYSAS